MCVGEFYCVLKPPVSACPYDGYDVYFLVSGSLPFSHGKTETRGSLYVWENSPGIIFICCPSWFLMTRKVRKLLPVAFVDHSSILVHKK